MTRRKPCAKMSPMGDTKNGETIGNDRLYDGIYIYPSSFLDDLSMN